MFGISMIELNLFKEFLVEQCKVFYPEYSTEQRAAYEQGVEDLLGMIKARSEDNWAIEMSKSMEGLYESGKIKKEV